ncbi:MAG: ATP-binding protein [Elusimicrobiota bacterium]
MKQILVISGKGGTGKTVLTASFAVLAKNKIMVDCDVDAADLYILLKPKILERNKFVGGKSAVIDESLCIKCGQCKTVCRFEAFDDNFNLDPISCEGCGFCSIICPVDAIKMSDNISGEWFISETKYGDFVHAKLGIAEENSGKLVAKIRDEAKKLAEAKKADYVIIDGPPGIGCPVMASLAGIDLAVIITEPTVSGIHDMQRVMELAKHFKITTKVVINKFDLNLENCEKVKSLCAENNIEILGLISFDSVVSKSIVVCMPLVEYTDGKVSQEIRNIWDKIICKIC